MSKNYKAGDIIDERYKLIKQLGDGRVGQVYLAKDSINNISIAIKILKQSLDSEREVIAFEREFLSVKNLKHPGIVKVLEQGSSYFTMEYVEGKTLKSLCGKEVSRIFEVCIEITKIIEYIHGQGVIHRDLKPDNIKIDSLDKTKILDFGFSICDNVKNIQENNIAGTLDYMAPEMIKGFQIDPRADLYSLGIIFYELTTGKLPFKSSDILTTVLKQISSPATPPSEINKKITPGFENIILKLIDKTPSRRYQSASELLGAMLKLAGKSEILSIRIERGHKLLGKPVFSGREKEISKLSLGLTRFLKGKNYCAFVSGEEGTGKTSLITHFQSQIPKDNIVVCNISTQKNIDTIYPIFFEMINIIFGRLENSKFFDEILERWGNLFYSLSSEFFSDKLKRLDLSQLEKISDQQMEEKICEFFIEITKHYSLLIFIDDLHLLNKKNNMLLFKFVHSLKNAPIFFCGTYCKQENTKNYFEKVLARLKWDKICEEVLLEPLSSKDITLLCESMIDGKTIDDNIAKKIYEISRGIPVLAIETIKKLADDMLIFKKGGKWQIEIDDLRKIQRPAVLEESLFEKYKNLGVEEKKIVQIAAVMTYSFDYHFIANILSLRSEQIEKILQKLVNSGFLLGHNQSIAIASPKLAQKIYNEIAVKTRETIHTKIAKELTANASLEKQYIEEIAYHYSQTQDFQKAVRYLLDAADLCSRQYMYAAAIEYYQKILSLRPIGSKEKAKTLAKLGDIYVKSGNLSDALQVYEDALELCKHDHIELASIHKGLGDVYFKKGVFDKAIHYYKLLLEKLRLQGEKIAEELAVMASVYTVMGAYHESEKLLQESLELARQEKNYELQASLYSNFGEICFINGQLPNAMNYYFRAFETLQTSKNLHVKAKVAKGIAHTYIRKGQADEAYRYLEEGLYICETIGDKDLFIMLKLDLGLLFEYKGNLQQALNIYHDTLDMAKEADIKQGEAYASLYLARVLSLTKKNREAHELIKNSLSIFSELKIQWALSESFIVSGQIYLDNGDYDLASEEFANSEKILVSIGMKWALSSVYLGFAKIYCRTDRNEEANKILNKALRLSKKHDDDIMIGKVQTQYAIFCSENNHNQEALEHFISAIVFLERVNCKLELAKTYYEYGKALLNFEKKGDHGFIKVAISQLEKAKEIYEESGSPMLSTVSSLIKECEREKADVRYKRDLKSKLYELQQEILQVEIEYQGQIQDLQKELSELGNEMIDISEIDNRISKIQEDFSRKLKKLTEQNNKLTQQVEDLKVERESLLTLQKISNIINSVLESKKLFDFIMDMTIRELKAERGFVVLKNNDNDFSFKAARNMEEEELSSSESNLSTSIVKKVIQTGEAVLTSDAQADGRFQSQSIVDLKLRSILCVPLVIKEKTIGAVYVDNRFVSGLFTQKDFDFLVAFSNQAAIALENAFLYEELKEKERIEQEISIAAKIQEGLLPKKLPEIKGLEIYGKMIPARQVGGDYYDFIESPEKETLSIAIGDVSGKGVPAGLVMVMARLILHHFLNDSNFSTKEILSATNRLLKDNTEPFIFMSMSLVRWDYKKQKLVYTGAGHENLIILRKDKDSPDVIPAGGVVLGVKESIDDFLEEKELFLNEGDSIILYTDGVTEAMSPSGDMLEMDGFLQIVDKHKDKSPEDIVHGILEDLRGFMKQREQHDDITLTVLRKVSLN